MLIEGKQSKNSWQKAAQSSSPFFQAAPQPLSLLSQLGRFIRAHAHSGEADKTKLTNDRFPVGTSSPLSPAPYKHVITMLTATIGDNHEEVDEPSNQNLNHFRVFVCGVRWRFLDAVNSRWATSASVMVLQSGSDCQNFEVISVECFEIIHGWCKKVITNWIPAGNGL